MTVVSTALIQLLLKSASNHRPMKIRTAVADMIMITQRPQLMNTHHHGYLQINRQIIIYDVLQDLLPYNLAECYSRNITANMKNNNN